MPIMPTKDSFQVRVKNAVKGNYHPSMRRSLQSIALYEADRCLTLTHRYPQLRPFQKKWALFATAVELLRTLDFLNYYQRQEIMFRTNASKEPLAPDLAWRRMKLITREINSTILPKAKELIENDDNSEKTHEEICTLLLQSMYEESNENSKPHPPMWEFNHNNVFSVYRVYYRGVAVDPKIFPALPPKVVEVPLRKPANFRFVPNNVAGCGDDVPSIPSIPLANMSISPGKGWNNGEISEEERRAMLKEVKDHTELLKEFEGIIPDEELVKRKRALYLALPPVPPPAGPAGPAGGGKKQKKKAKVATTAAAAVPAATKPAVAIPAATKPAVAITAATKPAVAIPVTTKPAAAIPAATKPTAMEEEDWEKVGADDEEDESTKSFAAV